MLGLKPSVASAPRWIICAVVLALVSCQSAPMVIRLPVPDRDEARITVIDKTGLLKTAIAPINPLSVDGPSSTFAWNPGGDLYVLRLEWAARRCLTAATILIRQEAGLQLEVSSQEEMSGGGCSEDVARRYVIDLLFSRAIPADSVAATDTTPRPEPSD